MRVRRPGRGVLAEDAIIRDLKAKIAGYKVAKRAFFVDDLPRSTLGKVEKRALRDRYRNALSPAGS